MIILKWEADWNETPCDSTETNLESTTCTVRDRTLRPSVSGPHSICRLSIVESRVTGYILRRIPLSQQSHAL